MKHKKEVTYKNLVLMILSFFVLGYREFTILRRRVVLIGCGEGSGGTGDAKEFCDRQ